ncbi:MAG: glycosyltransferase [Nitrospiraceae bacterium]|nr:glycosyltransferase [Nitrospiraceae bacterium]
MHGSAIMPRVSVIIPTFNCERYLEQTVQSVLAQTYADYEVIVVDDGSTDGTHSLMAQYGRVVRYFRQANQGASAARNLAMHQAKGEFIAYLDADDLWMPDKLAMQVAYMDAHPRCGLLHTEVSVIDEQNRVLHARFNQETGRAVPEGACIRDLLIRSHIQTLTVMERRRVFDAAGEFDRRLPVAQDYLHWISVALLGWEIGYIPEPLGQYRWRQGSLMGNSKRLLEDIAMINHILLVERDIDHRFGRDLGDFLRDQLFNTQRQIAYLERREGKVESARKRLRGLLSQHPWQWRLYLDFLKTYLHQPSTGSVSTAA